MIIIDILAFVGGLVVVISTVHSAIRTFVLPRSAPDGLTRLVYLVVRRLFDWRLHLVDSYLERDRIMAYYSPFALLALPPSWLGLVLIGYMGMFWALGVQEWPRVFLVSGSSLFTLGFATVDTLPQMILAFSEATIGLILVALLIAYLPTMYSNFSRRETAVTLLAVRAGSPPSAVEMILRVHRIGLLGDSEMHEFWREWEAWFAELEESHTSLASLVFFRSPNPNHSWVTASGAVLDTAALTVSVLDVPRDPQVDLCIRAGYLALRRIADFFRIQYHSDPHYPDDPISISRAEFDAVCERLADGGVPLKADREQAWHDFAGWRVNYDTVLLAVARLVMAPEAPWSSDGM
jgi:hypothetical protein